MAYLASLFSFIYQKPISVTWNKCCVHNHIIYKTNLQCREVYEAFFSLKLIITASQAAKHKKNLITMLREEAIDFHNESFNCLFPTLTAGHCALFAQAPFAVYSFSMHQNKVCICHVQPLNHSF